MTNLNKQSKYGVIEWSLEKAEAFRRLALTHKDKIDTLVKEGYFDHPEEQAVTIDAEQETMIINLETGKPFSIESMFGPHPLARPDTTEYFCEFDGGGVTKVDSAEDIFKFKERFSFRFTSIKDAVDKLSNGKAYPFSIGTFPFEIDARKYLLKDATKQVRYQCMEHMTHVLENKQKKLIVQNDITGETFEDIAANLSAMARCASTQPHFGFPTAVQTLEAYNVSVAITPVLVALFSDSPFVGGVDSGLVCSRLSLLEQSEQVRGGLAQPASSLAQHYEHVLTTCLPPCVSDTQDPSAAFMLSYGTTHHTTRIITDIENKTTRIEVRCLDSLPVDLAMQAIVFCLGVFKKLKPTDLATYEETKENFTNAIREGLLTNVKNKGTEISMQEFSLQMIQNSKEGLSEMGLTELIHEFIEPLEKFVKHGINRADITRSKVKAFEEKGMQRKEALIAILKDKVQVFK